MLNSPSACKHGHPCDVAGIKEAATCALQHDPERGSQVELVASMLDIKPGTLRDAVNPHEPDWLSMRHFDTVTIATANHPVIARHVAKLQGGFFYKVGAGTFDQKTATSVKEFGEFLQALTQGPITPSVLERVRKEGTEALASIKALMDYAELRAKTEGV